MNNTKSTDKYQSLYDLQYSLTKLFEGFDYHPDQVKLKIPNKFQRTLDHYINGGVDRDFVNDLREQIDAVIDIAEGKRLDAWSAEETAKEYKKKLEEYEKMISDQLIYIHSLKEELSAQTLNNASIVKDPSLETKETEKPYLDVVTEIIALRDRQMLKKDHLASIGEPEDAPSYKIIDATLRETAQILKNMGVDVLDVMEKFSPYEQTAVGTEETEDEALWGTVFSVVRPGYRYHGEVLRVAEVIVYTKKA